MDKCFVHREYEWDGMEMARNRILTLGACGTFVGVGISGWGRGRVGLSVMVLMVAFWRGLGRLSVKNSDNEGGLKTSRLKGWKPTSLVRPCCRCGLGGTGGLSL